MKISIEHYREDFHEIIDDSKLELDLRDLRAGLGAVAVEEKIV